MRNWLAGPGCDTSHSDCKGVVALALSRRWIWVSIRCFLRGPGERGGS